MCRQKSARQHNWHKICIKGREAAGGLFIYLFMRSALQPQSIGFDFKTASCRASLDPIQAYICSNCCPCRHMLPAVDNGTITFSSCCSCNNNNMTTWCYCFVFGPPCSPEMGKVSRPEEFLSNYWVLLVTMVQTASDYWALQKITGHLFVKPGMQIFQSTGSLLCAERTKPC